MVLSNKKLKQNLREAKAGVTPALLHLQRHNTESAALRSAKKRKKKRRNSQPPAASTEPAIEDDAEAEGELEGEVPGSAKKRKKKKKRLRSQPPETRTEPAIEDEGGGEGEGEGDKDEGIGEAEIQRYLSCIVSVLHKHPEDQHQLDYPVVSFVEAGSERPDTTSNFETAPAEGQQNARTADEQKIGSEAEPRPSAQVGQRSTKKKSKKPHEDGVSIPDTDPLLGAKDSMEERDPMNSRTVYAGGIPYYSSEDDIKAFFGVCGSISDVSLKTFPDSGRFRGIALITFKTEEACKRALALDGANMGECFLKVQPSVSRSKGSRKKGESRKEPLCKTEGYTRAYVGNLSWNITEEDLRDFFQGCRIDGIRLARDKTTGEFQGYGHIDFADDESLEMALQWDQQPVLGRPIKIAYAVRKKENEEQKISRTSGKREQTPRTGRNEKQKSNGDVGAQFKKPKAIPS